MTFTEAIDFFFSKLTCTTGEADRKSLLENPPTLHELACAIHVAVYKGEPIENAFSAALVILNHWGKLEWDKEELGYDKAVKALAGKEEYVEEMKIERGTVDMVVNHVNLNVSIGKELFPMIEAALRVLYEYKLWDLKTLEEGKADEYAEVEGSPEGA